MNARSCAALAVAALLLGAGAHATSVSLGSATPNPSLVARANGIQDELHERSLDIANLKLDVNVVGLVATTTLFVQFSNPAREVTEGEFSLTLPDGAVVIGYALDIEGKMVDGVLAEQPKARAFYEEKVRQGIDPGVAEITRGNVFSTRIFPIRPGSGRSIRITFAAPVHPANGFALPLVTTGSVGKLEIRLRTADLKQPPRIQLPAKLELQWRDDSGSRISIAQASNISLTGELRLSGVEPTQPLLATTHPTGLRFFQLDDRFVGRAAGVRNPERVRIYWDRSLSRRDDMLADEIALIGRYLAAVHPQAIDLVVFNSSGARVETGIAADAALSLLQHAVYRGATSFAVLESLKLPEAGLCLLFSDGVGTIDRRDRFRPDCEVIAITSARDADRGFLDRLARNTGGAVLRLDQQTVDDMLGRLQRRVPHIVDIRDATGASLAYTVIDNGPNHLTAVGQCPSGGEIIVRIAGGNRKVIERRYAVPAASDTAFQGAGALWAANRVGELAIDDDQADEMHKLSRRFSIASPAMSFIVLETPYDYVQADIEPPQNYPKSGWTAYLSAKASHDAELASARKQRIDLLVNSWSEQKSWWGTQFPLKKIKAADKKDREESPRYEPMADAVAAPAPAQASPALPEARTRDNASRRAQEVVVTGSRAATSNLMMAAPITVTRGFDEANREASSGAVIELVPWNPDRPYLKKLSAAPAGSADRVIAEQEATFGDRPAFYFDVAQWLKRNHRDADAAEMLLSALELPSVDPDTLAIVADRLQRYGQSDRAVWLLEKLNRLIPDRPQPQRLLALALVKRTASGSADGQRRDLARALDLLTEVVMTPWPNAYDGVEMIALMEANDLVPRARTAGITKIPLDARLVALLDVDLRVTLEWNTPATDMDLWVDEPGGERAIYNHPRTELGGRLSNDMTQGYGPEEYLLRRAPNGTYQIRVNVYAADRINPNGATIITAHLIRDFGRSTEREETMDIELKAGAAGEQLVGTFTVAK